MRKGFRDLGSGTIISLGLMAAIVSGVLLIGNLSIGQLQQTRLNELADNAAIGAADSLRGLNTGYPCEVAKAIAAQFSNCYIVDDDVIVELREGNLVAKARAGP